MFNDFIFDEQGELQVELLEVVKYGFDGVGKVLEPGHHVHYAACPHSLRELVVPAHHLLKLFVLIRVSLPKAHRAHDVGRGHHQVRRGLKIPVLLSLLHKQLQQLFDLADDVVLECLLGVRVPGGEHPHSGLRHFAVQLPPVRGAVEGHAVPSGHKREGREVRSAGKLGSLLDQRLLDAVSVQHHYVAAS